MPRLHSPASNGRGGRTQLGCAFGVCVVLVTAAQTVGAAAAQGNAASPLWEVLASGELLASAPAAPRSQESSKRRAQPRASVSTSVSVSVSAPAASTVSTSASALADSAELLYRHLFDVHAALGRAEPGERDSLLAVRAALVAAIARLHRQRGVPEAEIEEKQRDVDALVRELDRFTEGIDWERLSSELGESLEDFESGLERLGERLENLELELGPEHIRLQDLESGSNVTIVIPPEIRRSIERALGAVKEELETALGDSLAGELDVPAPDRRRPARPRTRTRVIQIPAPGSTPGQQPWWTAWRAHEAPTPRHVVGKTVFKVFDDFTVRGNEIVQGDVIVVGGKLRVEGQVIGNAIVILGGADIRDSAEIARDLISIGSRVDLEGSPDVGGNIVDVSTGRVGLGFAQWMWKLPDRKVLPWAFVLHAVWLGAMLLILVVLVAVLGERVRLLGEHALHQPLRHFAVGIVWIVIADVAFAVVGLALAITIIGIPVALVAAVALLCVFLAAYLLSCQALGTRLLHWATGAAPRSAWLGGAVGLVLLEVPTFVALALSAAEPLREGAVLLRLLAVGMQCVALVVGFGVLASTRFGRKMPAPLAPAADAGVLSGAGAST